VVSEFQRRGKGLHALCRHEGGIWFAQLRFLLSYTTPSGDITQCALVRYLKELGEEHKDDYRQKLDMPWLEWSKIIRRRDVDMPVIGWIYLESLQGPAYLQPDPKLTGR
jgi:hypothetical protein